MLQSEAQSPYLPGTNIQYAWDSTSLGYFKTCPRLYYYQMIEGYATKAESIHLRFGIEWHQAMQDYAIFKANNLDHEDALQETVRALLIRCADFSPKEEDYGEVARYKNKENLIRLVIWYLDQHKNDPCETYIKEDGTPAVELTFKFELDWGPKKLQYKSPSYGDDSTSLEQGPPYLLCGHLDRVVNYQDDLYFMDYKTTKSTPGQYFFDQFSPNNQMSLYVLAAKLILKSPVRGGIINAIQCSVDYSYMKIHSPFKRGFVYRTQEQIDEWLRDLAYWLNKAEEFATQNYWPMNDTACDKFGGCRFREICQKSPQVRDRFLNSNFTKGEPWNPLKAR